MKLVIGDEVVQVITNETPLGIAMLGKFEGDEFSLQIAQTTRHFEVLKVS